MSHKVKYHICHRKYKKNLMDVSLFPIHTAMTSYQWPLHPVITEKLVLTLICSLLICSLLRLLVQLEASRGQVHLSASGTSLITASACKPQPLTVNKKNRLFYTTNYYIKVSVYWVVTNWYKTIWYPQMWRYRWFHWHQVCLLNCT